MCRLNSYYVIFVFMMTSDIKRTSSFYVNLFVWPCVFILLITMSMFILPPTCVERITMGVLLLLTMVIMSLMLDSYTPKSSSSVSVIGRLIGFTMFMIAWSTLASSLVVILDRDRFTYVAIPMWIKTVWLIIISFSNITNSKTKQKLSEPKVIHIGKKLRQLLNHYFISNFNKVIILSIL